MLSPSELDSLVLRLESAYRKADGFVDCRVESYAPPVILFETSDAKAASAIRFELQLRDYPGRLEIKHEQPTMLRLYR